MACCFKDFQSQIIIVLPNKKQINHEKDLSINVVLLLGNGMGTN
jgi:hypothetical protein